MQQDCDCSLAGRLAQHRMLSRLGSGCKGTVEHFCSRNVPLWDAPASRVSRGRERSGRARRCQQMALFVRPARRAPAGPAPPGSGTRGRAGTRCEWKHISPRGEPPASREVPLGVSAQDLLCAQGSLLSVQARECEPSQTCGPTHGWPAGAKVITWDLCLGSVKVPGIIRKAVK